MKCHLCESAAVAVFNFPAGCACSDDEIQPLCAQHAFKATPRGGMLLIEDLTIDEEFTLAWAGPALGRASTGTTGAVIAQARTL